MHVCVLNLLGKGGVELLFRVALIEHKTVPFIRIKLFKPTGGSNWAFTIEVVKNAHAKNTNTSDIFKPIFFFFVILITKHTKSLFVLVSMYIS